MTTSELNACLDSLTYSRWLLRTSTRSADRANAAERLSELYARLAEHEREEHERALAAYMDDPAF